MIGLYNLGNTCFLNSAIQCLMAAKPLVNYFESIRVEPHLDLSNINNAKDEKKDSNKGEVAHAFGSLVKIMWTQDSYGKVYPIKFCKTIEKNFP